MTEQPSNPRGECGAAIVTGAGKGMGRSFALRLSAAGYAVAVVDLSREWAEETCRLVVAAGGSARAYAHDVGRIAEIEPLIERVESELGPVHVLVNNAGMIKTQPLLEVGEEDWDRIMGVNAKGAFFFLQAVAKRMVARGRGSIINIGSVGARSARPKHTMYGASKAALLHLTKSGAAALGRYGVRVNAICPGVIETSMWDQVRQQRTAEEVQAILASIPLQRTGASDEVADVVAFLAGEASRYVNGQALNVCGGLEMD